MIYKHVDGGKMNRYNFYILSGTDVGIENEDFFIKRANGYSIIRKIINLPKRIIAKIGQGFNQSV